MNIEVTEEFPGELASFTPEVLHDKLAGALPALAKSLFEERAKTATDDGEVDALEELRQDLEKSFAIELDAIRAALEKEIPP